MDMSKKLRKTKSLKLLLLFAFALIVVFVILANFPSETGILLTTPTTTTTTTQPTATTLPPTTTTIPVSKGTLIIAFKDEDQKIPGGAVLKSMNFTVTGIEVYNEPDDEWTSVLDGEKTLDLLKYTTTYAKIAEKEIDAGGYDKIKLMFSDGSISLVHTLLGIYNPKVYTLSVQEETTVDYEFNITDGSTLTLILDFDVKYSVMRVGVGYSLTPIIDISEQFSSATNMEEI